MTAPAPDRPAPHPDPAVPATPPPPPARSRSVLRSWLVVALVLGIAAVYCVVWGAYVDMRAVDHYRQLPPGASTQAYGLTVEVERIGVLDAFSPSGFEPEPPVPGAVWVEAVVSVEGSYERDFETCRYPLLGPQGRVWEPELRYDDDVVSECGPELGAVTVSLVYQVPEADLDQILGVVVDPGDPFFKTSRVLRP